MPLFSIDTPKYLNRKRVFIDTDFRNLEQSTSEYDCVFNLDTQYEKVQSIELVAFQVPKFIVPTFAQQKTHENGTQGAGNNMLDIRLRDVPFTRELVFSVEFPESYFTTTQELANMIPGIIEAAMDAEGDAFFNTGAGVNITTSIETLYQGQMLRILSDIGGDQTLISMEFLFGSGANKDTSAWKVLGFMEGVDVGGQSITTTFGATNDPFPTRVPLLKPFRYLDIFIDEFDELSPIARVYLTDKYTSVDQLFAPTNNPTDHESHNKLLAPRLLSSQPLRYIQTFNMRIRFEDNIRPFEEFQRFGMDFIFDMIILSPEQSIPIWVEQRLTY